VIEFISTHLAPQLNQSERKESASASKSHFLRRHDPVQVQRVIELVMLFKKAKHTTYQYLSLL